MSASVLGHALAKERRRFGYRRLHVLLRREGLVVNHKRHLRIYRAERLMVRQRGGRKRALGTRAPMPVALLPNDRRALDSVSDQYSGPYWINLAGNVSLVGFKMNFLRSWSQLIG